MPNIETWDYPQMYACASALDELVARSNSNKSVMDSAFETLTAGMQAETGRAFLLAYAEHVPSIELFAEVLNTESELLRTNANTMQEEDERIAAEVRRIFGV